MKASPLSHLEMEIVQDKTNISKVGSASGYDNLIRDQVPVQYALSGADTFKQDASTPTSRAKVETDRMHVDGGADLKGASMFKEFGGGTGKSSTEFTSDKSK